jgi:hypothetical protein
LLRKKKLLFVHTSFCGGIIENKDMKLKDCVCLLPISGGGERVSRERRRRMDSKCELLEKCGFFRKYKAQNDTACRGFIRMYCNGPQMDECRRKAYRMQHGAPPTDDMMPNGALFPV